MTGISTAAKHATLRCLTLVSRSRCAHGQPQARRRQAQQAGTRSNGPKRPKAKPGAADGGPAASSASSSVRLAAGRR
jgi:hypothetical protein